MPVQQTYKVSDIEKRLKLLNLQLHGKNIKQSPTESYSVSDLTYLKQDLRKIVFLAMIAIGVQFILFFSQLPGRIKFF